VIESGGAATVMLKPFDAVTLAASVTRTLNENVPAEVGVPESVPVPFSVTPAGKLPDSSDHV
jgi:hypothetical protein